MQPPSASEPGQSGPAVKHQTVAGPANGSLTPREAGLPSPVKTRLFTAPPASNPDFAMEDAARKKSLLGMMLLVLSVMTLVMLPLSWIFGYFITSDLGTIIMVLLALLISYGALWLNYNRLAGYILVYGVILALVVRSLSQGALSLSNISNNYFAVAGCVVLAGLIIGPYAPFTVTFSALAIFSMIFWNYANTSGADVNDAIRAVLYCSGIHLALAFMSWASARTSQKTLARIAGQNTQLLDVNRQLQENLRRDRQIGDNINLLSVDLMTISQDQSNRAHGQAQSVTIVTSTLEELSATARQIAEVAESVFTATEQAMHTAETGGSSVGHSIDGIAALTAQVETISRIANELGNQSRRISEIVETISELAEETNLLALNATIEAAGAGEYGRRFAVVAGEVQMLANRSRAASRDVQNILNQIRKAINNTLLATDEGLEEARRISEVAGQAGEAIEQIIETVESTTFLARQIFLTTQQQRSATDQAVELVRNVAEDSREAATRAQRLLVAGDHLSRTATSLRDN